MTRYPMPSSAKTLPMAISSCLLLLAAATTDLRAQESQQEETFSVSGAIALGAEHNNNLSITELETASGQSDVAATLDANIDLSWRPSSRLSLDTGYSYTASRYQDVTAFDLDMHLLYADISYAFDWLTLGANHYYADADLGGDSFLTLKQSSLYAGKLIGEQWFLRGALNFVRKDFDTFTERDADTDGFGLDGFWFFNEGRSNLSLGYAFEDEQTRGASFVYKADTVRLRFSHRFNLWGKEARFQTGYRWHDRRYPNITPSIGVPRDDTHKVADARLEVTVWKSLAVLARWENGNYRSNLPSADFSDNRLSLAARLSF